MHYSAWHMKYTISSQPLLALVAAIVVSACSGDNGKKETGASENIYEAQSTIGPSGGVLGVTDVESPLHGVSITIPPGAFSGEKEITIELPESHEDLPLNYLAAASPVDFGPDGAVFDHPVEIVLPYRDTDNDGIIDGTDLSETGVEVFFYDASEKAWAALPRSGLDTLKNRVTVAASHFTLFLVAITPTGDDGDDGTDPQILAGEYFRGEPEFYEGALILKGCINRKGMRCGSPYYLTVRYFGGLKPEAVIDRWPTTNTGPKVTIDEDGTAVTFDAAPFFEKVKRSGSAALWQWQCEFNTHTQLVNFEVLDDEDVTVVNGFYPEISVLDSGKVHISWKFDLQTYFSVGDQIVIAFEAYYK